MGIWPASETQKVIHMIVMPNKTLHATATVLCGCEAAWKHSAVVAVAYALPVAVRELGR